MIKRKNELNYLSQLLKLFPVTAILGPRQVGKTTLSMQFNADHHIDLENPRDFAMMSQPQLALEALSGLIIIDEIQKLPELFPLLRYLVDTRKDQRYIILGSASPELIKQSSETLAGRIGYLELQGFNLLDIGFNNWRKLWLRGGFPRSYTAENDQLSTLWIENYISTFLERDIPQLGINIPAATMRRFWIMLSHYHGQELNYSEFSRSFGVSDMTIRRYIDILEGTYMVRVLQPWHINTSKRLIKRPKLYIRDSGILHSLMSIHNEKELLTSNKLGASWEGFALEQSIRITEINNKNFFFWGTHSGAEVDLFWKDGGRNHAIEVKYTDAPRCTKSMQSALKDLSLDQLWVIYPGEKSYPLSEKITALSLQDLTVLKRKR
jgi:predicted AAA+ superfamily ATPase